MQQASDFLEECDAIHDLVSSLGDSELQSPTLFKAWTINDIFEHVHVWNYAADLSLNDEAAFKALVKACGAHIKQGGTMKSFETEWLDGLSGRELVEAWRDYYAGMAGRFGGADPKKRVAWVGPSMSVRSSITARLMETWAHAQAIYDVMGVARIDTDRIANIVRLGVNTYGWTFQNRKQEPPGPMPHLRLTAPSGELWTFGETSSDEVIEGAATAFCQVVTQTRNIADTDLIVTGTISRDWMDNAQCFAGAAHPPPPPGVRKIAATSIHSPP